jgi:hypothetical protein
MTTRTTRANNTGDHALVRAVLSGDQKAAEQFLRTVADTVWTENLSSGVVVVKSAKDGV